MKHTPAPWTSNKVGVVYGPSESIVCFLRGYYGSEEAEANAKLIAAAPDLLDSLRILYEETADYIRLNHLGDVHHNRSMQYARDTIAKAEGKP